MGTPMIDNNYRPCIPVPKYMAVTITEQRSDFQCLEYNNQRILFQLSKVAHADIPSHLNVDTSYRQRLQNVQGIRPQNWLDVEVENGNPSLFWSVGEDGYVRQYDVRISDMQQNQFQSANALIHVANRRKYIELKGMDINQKNPYQMAVAAQDTQIRIFDRRKLSLSTPGGNRENTQAVLEVSPPHLQLESQRQMFRPHSTYVSFSNKGDKVNQNRTKGIQLVLATYHGDHAYAFDIRQSAPQNPSVIFQQSINYFKHNSQNVDNTAARKPKSLVHNEQGYIQKSKKVQQSEEIAPFMVTQSDLSKNKMSFEMLQEATYGKDHNLLNLNMANDAQEAYFSDSGDSISDIDQGSPRVNRGGQKTDSRIKASKKSSLQNYCYDNDYYGLVNDDKDWDYVIPEKAHRAKELGNKAKFEKKYNEAISYILLNQITEVINQNDGKAQKVQAQQPLKKAKLYMIRAQQYVERKWQSDLIYGLRDCNQAIAINPTYFKAYEICLQILISLKQCMAAKLVKHFIQKHFPENCMQTRVQQLFTRLQKDIGKEERRQREKYEEQQALRRQRQHYYSSRRNNTNTATSTQNNNDNSSTIAQHLNDNVVGYNSNNYNNSTNNNSNQGTQIDGNEQNRQDSMDQQLLHALNYARQENDSPRNQQQNLQSSVYSGNNNNDSQYNNERNDNSNQQDGYNLVQYNSNMANQIFEAGNQYDPINNYDQNLQNFNSNQAPSQQQEPQYDRRVQNNLFRGNVASHNTETYDNNVSYYNDSTNNNDQRGTSEQQANQQLEPEYNNFSNQVNQRSENQSLANQNQQTQNHLHSGFQSISTQQESQYYQPEGHNEPHNNQQPGNNGDDNNQPRNEESRLYQENVRSFDDSANMYSDSILYSYLQQQSSQQIQDRPMDLEQPTPPDAEGPSQDENIEQMPAIKLQLNQFKQLSTASTSQYTNIPSFYDSNPNLTSSALPSQTTNPNLNPNRLNLPISYDPNLHNQSLTDFPKSIGSNYNELTVGGRAPSNPESATQAYLWQRNVEQANATQGTQSSFMDIDQSQGLENQQNQSAMKLLQQFQVQEKQAQKVDKGQQQQVLNSNIAQSSEQQNRQSTQINQEHDQNPSLGTISYIMDLQKKLQQEGDRKMGDDRILPQTRQADDRITQVQYDSERNDIGQNQQFSTGGNSAANLNRIGQSEQGKIIQINQEQGPSVEPNQSPLGAGFPNNSWDQGLRNSLLKILSDDVKASKGMQQNNAKQQQGQSIESSKVQNSTQNNPNLSVLTQQDQNSNSKLGQQKLTQGLSQYSSFNYMQQRMQEFQQQNLDLALPQAVQQAAENQEGTASIDEYKKFFQLCQQRVVGGSKDGDDDTYTLNSQNQALLNYFIQNAEKGGNPPPLDQNLSQLRLEVENSRRQLASQMERTRQVHGDVYKQEHQFYTAQSQTQQNIDNNHLYFQLFNKFMESRGEQEYQEWLKQIWNYHGILVNYKNVYLWHLRNLAVLKSQLQDSNLDREVKKLQDEASGLSQDVNRVDFLLGKLKGYLSYSNLHNDVQNMSQEAIQQLQVQNQSQIQDLSQNYYQQKDDRIGGQDDQPTQVDGNKQSSSNQHLVERYQLQQQQLQQLQMWYQMLQNEQQQYTNKNILDQQQNKTTGGTVWRKQRPDSQDQSIKEHHQQSINREGHAVDSKNDSLEKVLNNKKLSQDQDYNQSVDALKQQFAQAQQYAGSSLNSLYNNSVFNSNIYSQSQPQFNSNSIQGTSKDRLTRQASTQSQQILRNLQVHYQSPPVLNQHTGKTCLSEPNVESSSLMNGSGSQKDTTNQATDSDLDFEAQKEITSQALTQQALTQQELTQQAIKQQEITLQNQQQLQSQSRDMQQQLTQQKQLMSQQQYELQQLISQQQQQEQAVQNTQGEQHEQSIYQAAQFENMYQLQQQQYYMQIQQEQQQLQQHQQLLHQQQVQNLFREYLQIQQEQQLYQALHDQVEQQSMQYRQHMQPQPQEVDTITQQNITQQQDDQNENTHTDRTMGGQSNRLQEDQGTDYQSLFDSQQQQWQQEWQQEYLNHQEFQQQQFLEAQTLQQQENQYNESQYAQDQQWRQEPATNYQHQQHDDNNISDNQYNHNSNVGFREVNHDSNRINQTQITDNNTQNYSEDNVNSDQIQDGIQDMLSDLPSDEDDEEDEQAEEYVYQEYQRWLQSVEIALEFFDPNSKAPNLQLSHHLGLKASTKDPKFRKAVYQNVVSGGLWAGEGAQRVTNRYIGQCNMQTDIKECVYLDQEDKLVACGSDDGKVFIYNAETGEAIRVLKADEEVANCVQPNPFLPVIATSGIESVVKFWSPRHESPDPSQIKHDLFQSINSNQQKYKEGPYQALRFHQRLLETPNLVDVLYQLGLRQQQQQQQQAQQQPTTQRRNRAQGSSRQGPSRGQGSGNVGMEIDQDGRQSQERGDNEETRSRQSGLRSMICNIS